MSAYFHDMHSTYLYLLLYFEFSSVLANTIAQHVDRNLDSDFYLTDYDFHNHCFCDVVYHLLVDSYGHTAIN